MSHKLTGVVISDLHAGDLLAPIPRNYQTCQQETYLGNSAQQALANAFYSLTEEWQKPDLLIILGDAVGGQDRRAAGTTVWSTQPLDQIKAAYELLREFHARHICVVRGSAYHVSVNGLPAEEVLAERLHAEKIGIGGYRSAIKFMFEKWGYRMHFAHHVPTSQTEWYLTTPLAKEGIRLQLQHKRLGHVDAIFRGHNHYWDKIEFRTQTLISCPCWVLPGEFLHKRSGEPLTDIGAIRFQLNDKPDEFGEKLRVQKRLFDIKEAATRIVTI